MLLAVTLNSYIIYIIQVKHLAFLVGSMALISHMTEARSDAKSLSTTHIQTSSKRTNFGEQPVSPNYLKLFYTQ